MKWQFQRIARISNHRSIDETGPPGRCSVDYPGKTGFNLYALNGSIWVSLMSVVAYEVEVVDIDNNFDRVYGKLYSWHAVNSGMLCPSGWHVPSHTEFTTMTDIFGGFSAGGEMKETRTAHWGNPKPG